MSKWAALLLIGVVSCSSGGGDLNQLTENPKILGNPIAQQTAPSSRLKDGQTIRAQGVVVVAIDNYDDDGKGSVGDIYVQDPVQTGPKGTAWSGLRLYRPTKNPPDLELAPGQGVDLVGQFVAFGGPPGSPFNEGAVVPQASNAALTLTYEGTAPQPIDITVDDLKDLKTGMQYASRLVRMKNVALTDVFKGSRPEAAISGSSTLVLGAKLYPVHLDKTVNATKGVTLKSVTGVLDFFFNFKLCPRSRADIEL